jgi:hypothetical protein
MQANGTLVGASGLVASKFIRFGDTPHLSGAYSIGFAAAAQVSIWRKKEEYRFDVELQRKLYKAAPIQVSPTLRGYSYSIASNIDDHGLSTLRLYKQPSLPTVRRVSSRQHIILAALPK